MDPFNNLSDHFNSTSQLKSCFSEVLTHRSYIPQVKQSTASELNPIAQDNGMSQHSFSPQPLSCPNIEANPALQPKSVETKFVDQNLGFEPTHFSSVLDYTPRNLEHHNSLASKSNHVTPDDIVRSCHSASNTTF